MTKKSMVAMVMIVVCVCGMFSGCAHNKQVEKETVSLSIWGSEETRDMLEEMADAFKQKYKDEAEFDITVGTEDEDSLCNDVTDNPKGAADVYSYASDQLQQLVDAKALLPLDYEKEKIVKASGGSQSAAVQSGSVKDTLYGYPLTASNGYFLYYNADYFSDKDVKSFDKMLEIAAKNQKKISMDWSSGWYLYSFFGGAGFTAGLSDDKKHNICNWNQTAGKYSGKDVAKAMLAISSSDGFLNADEDRFKKGVKEGKVIAVVNGMWNANYFQKVWGEQYRAAKLPTYTLKKKQVQMASVAGYKLMGVNAYTKYPQWAMKLAAWVCNYDNQLKRFDVTGEGPANLKAAQSEKVKASPAVVALSEQSKYGVNLEVTDAYWKATTVFGTVMANGNPDNRDLQKLLDELVDDIEK